MYLGGRMTGNQTRLPTTLGFSSFFFFSQMELFQRSKIVSIQELTEKIKHSPNTTQNPNRGDLNPHRGDIRSNGDQTINSPKKVINPNLIITPQTCNFLTVPCIFKRDLALSPTAHRTMTSMSSHSLLFAFSFFL